MKMIASIFVEIIGMKIMTNGVKRRGFASMSEEKRKMIARKGGIASHKKGAAHEFSPAEAKVAGRKGGLAKKK